MLPNHQELIVFTFLSRPVHTVCVHCALNDYKNVLGRINGLTYSIKTSVKLFYRRPVKQFLIWSVTNGAERSKTSGCSEPDANHSFAFNWPLIRGCLEIPSGAFSRLATARSYLLFSFTWFTFDWVSKLTFDSKLCVIFFVNGDLHDQGQFLLLGIFGSKS